MEVNRGIVTCRENGPFASAPRHGDVLESGSKQCFFLTSALGGGEGSALGRARVPATEKDPGTS